MKYVNFGKPDLKVSRICIGCMGFGNPATGQHFLMIDEVWTRKVTRYRLVSENNL